MAFSLYHRQQDYTYHCIYKEQVIILGNIVIHGHSWLAVLKRS